MSVPRIKKPKTYSKKQISLAAVSAIFVASVLVYSNTLHSSFHLDDLASIINNESIRGLWNFSGLWSATPTRIVTYWTFALNYHVGGLDVIGYHIVNIGIHLVSALLVWRLLRLLLSTPVMKDTSAAKRKDMIALVGAMVFAVHPVQTQAITYIVQRAASLATMFYLATLCCYISLRLRKTYDVHSWFPSTALGASLILGSCFFTLLGLFSKETFYTLPFTIALIEIFFLQRRAVIRAVLLGGGFLIMLILAAVLYLGIRLPLPSTTGISRVEYFLTQMTVIPSYLRLLVVPVNQNLDYDIAIVGNPFNPAVLGGAMMILGLFIGAIALYKRNRLISFGVFLFFLTLAPESSIIPIKDLMFEHRLYLPMAGVAAVFAGIFAFFYGKTYNRYCIPAAAVIILGLGAAAFARNFIWIDDLTLWSDCIGKSPMKSRPYVNRGVAYGTLGMMKESLNDYNTALKLDPKSGEAYNNRANLYVVTKEYDKAVKDYSRAIDFGFPTGEVHADVYFNRATAYGQQAMYEDAIRDLTTYLSYRPADVMAYFDRGVAQYTLQRPDEALKDYNRALAINPNFGQAVYTRAVLEHTSGRYDQAIADYYRSISLNWQRGESYTNIGAIFLTAGKYDNAVAAYSESIRSAPNSPAVYAGRGTAFLALHKYGDAIQDLSKAIGLNPNFEYAYRKRAEAYQAMGRVGEALKDIESAKVGKSKK